jgi:hypothetical protein
MAAWDQSPLLRRRHHSARTCRKCPEKRHEPPSANPPPGQTPSDHEKDVSLCTRPLGGMADAGDLKGEQPQSVPIRYENLGGDVADRPPSSEPNVTGVAESDPVEAALAEALTRAAAAGQWGTVETLSRELQARRESRANVVQLDAARRRRER